MKLFFAVFVCALALVSRAEAGVSPYWVFESLKQENPQNLSVYLPLPEYKLLESKVGWWHPEQSNQPNQVQKLFIDSFYNPVPKDAPDFNALWVEIHQATDIWNGREQNVLCNTSGPNPSKILRISNPNLGLLTYCLSYTPSPPGQQAIYRTELMPGPGWGRFLQIKASAHSALEIQRILMALKPY